MKMKAELPGREKNPGDFTSMDNDILSKHVDSEKYKNYGEEK